ncbi:cobalt-precorrin-8 methylmutase [Methanocaldococcus infernus]
MGASTDEGLEIAKKSRDIVREKIKEYIKNFSEEELEIVERVVHATADPEFAKLLVFKNNPIKEGIRAIEDRVPIVVDVNMVKAGVRYENVICPINDKETLELAKKENITRAKASMRVAKNYIDDGIVVIGNSPTALLEVINLVKHYNVKPRLIIGVPVGFVKAEESKEKLLNLDLPIITCKGAKGGTPVAVSIINGIIAKALGGKA